MIDTYIGLGSNLGDRVANVAAGLAELASLPASELARVSHAYESEPWGPVGQPAYVNAVALVRTDLYADQMLVLLKEAEERLGRRDGPRYGPRAIDLDILLFGDEEWESEELSIPHPRMAERDFVIRPLLEIAPDAAYPDGSSVTDEDVRVGRIVADLGPVPGYEGGAPAPRSRAERRQQPGAAESPVEGWLPVGGPRYEGRYGASETDFTLLHYEALLNEAGIPSEFYPHRPGEWHLPWPYTSLGQPVRLMVPASRKAEADRLIEEATGDSP